MIKLQKNIPLKERTSFRIGGCAEIYAKPRAPEDLCYLVEVSSQRGFSLLILGKGTNLLISDRGWKGLVVDISEMAGIEWSGSSVVCQCGVLLSTLVKESVDFGLQGMESLAGIPGTVGGGVFMNAGAFNQTISDYLSCVEGVDLSSGERWRLERDAIEFGYRSSSFQKENAVILSAEFRLIKGDSGVLKETYNQVLGQRREKQPLDLPNCGSVFKRPPGDYAGRLIEKCGLKGFRFGDAMVSPKHANFIVNCGEATAADVRRLIVHIQKEVYNNFGTILEPEVVFAGEFEIPLFSPKEARQTG